jgi:hypothetical protein
MRGALSSSRAVRSVARWGDGAFREAGRPAVIDVWRTVLAKTDFLLRAYRGMDLRAFRAVLVATQHDPQIRALLWAAREQGVPIVYLPHAPVADNPQYSDLPVDVAGLRGPAERSFYARSYGVEEGSMPVVGNTASDVLRSPLPDLSGAPHGVLALSPNREDVIRRVIGLVAESGEDNVLVAPHPRSDREQIRGLLPARWRMSAEPRTLDVLRRGVRFVLQYSSGVAWESAALGIPTANIRLDGDVVNYPFLTDMTAFTEVRSPEDVRAFIAGAPRVDRDRLRACAREWCAHDGADAVVRARELLARAGQSGTAGHRLLDGWAEPDGPALLRSWLPAYAG